MSDITIVIGNKNYSSWSLRPWLALRQTGADFDEVVVPLRGGDTKEKILSWSAAGKVPVLRHGALTVWESLAICEYLADAFPDAGLWPADPAVRAVARAVAAEMHGGFTALRQNLPMDLTRRHPGAERIARAQGDIDRVISIWRDCRARYGSQGAHGAGPFLFGRFTIADAMYAPVVTRFLTYGVHLDATVEAYAASVLDLPAMRDWTAAAAAEPWVIAF